MNASVVYFKPGCPFGIRLRTALTLHRVPHRSVRFRDDEHGAAQVRAANDGNEISPTVHVNGRWLTNPGWREVREAAQDGDAVRIAEHPWAAPAGRALVGAALALVAYVVVAVTLGAGFEQDLASAAEREGVAVNAVATSEQARIVQDHTLYALITGLFLLLPPVLLLRAAARIRAGAGGRLALATWWSALTTLLVWWTYVGLGLGLFADPDDLPPLVRDFGPLTVPLVSALSLLALGSLVLAGEAVRGAGVVRRSARVATIVSITLAALSLVAMVAAGFEDPVVPLVILPGALILGVALLRSQRHVGRAKTSEAVASPHRSSVVGSRPIASGTHVRWRFLTVAVATTSMVLVGCGSDDSTSATETPSDTATPSATAAAPASEASAASPLEGSWQTGRISLEETEATVRRHGLGRWVEAYRNNAPFSADTVLTLTIEDGAWDLYGKAKRGQSEPIDYDAEYEIDGDTVVFHHSDGSNTYRWEVDGDVLRLNFERSTLPAYRGIPDEVFQRALYMTTTFARKT